MPERSFLIASHQVVALGGERGVLGLDLAQFFFGAQIDRAQPLALAAQPFELFLDLGEIGQRLAVGLISASAATAAGSISSMSWISRPMSESRRLAPSKRSSARARSSRAALAASSAARASRSASASAFSASCRRSAQARRAASAFATSLISAWRFSAKTCGAFSSSARSRLASAMRCSSVAIWLRAPLRRSIQPVLSAASVGQPPVGQFRFAHDRLLLGAHFGELGALAGDVVAHGGELAFEIGGGRECAERALGFGLGGVASSRLVVRRVRASARAESRAAWRLRSRSRARVSVSALAGGIEGCLRGFKRAALGVDLGARALTSSASISAKRLRCASRRAAPVGACAAATKPSQRHRSPSRDTSRWPVLSAPASRAPVSRSTTPICASRRASCAGALT